MHGRSGLSRGVSLIEALVALAVMAIGMLGLVGLQGNLRGNADLSKQRSEAVRLAQQEIERTRAFISYSGDAPNYVALANGSTTTNGIDGSNAVFTRTRVISDLPAGATGLPQSVAPGKSVTVTLAWADRTGETQNVTLTTVIAGVAPELAATLGVPGEGGLTRYPRLRHPTVPLGALNRPGTGTSVWFPPGADSGVVWRFDNITARITLCTTSAVTLETITDADLICPTPQTQAYLVSGFLRYALGTAPQTAQPLSQVPTPAPVVSMDFANADIRSTLSCPQVSGIDAGTLTGYTAFACAVPLSAVDVVLPGGAVIGVVYRFMEGRIRIGSGGAAEPKVTASTTAPEGTANASLRPCRYAYTTAEFGVTQAPQPNQNFLLISAGDRPATQPGGGSPFACPSGTVAFNP